MQTQIVNNTEIHCKVQYGNEFRRFLLKDSYAALLEQVRTLFSFESVEDLCIKYTDDEGDLVTISSDEELVFAIELFPNSVLRLTVTGPVKKHSRCDRDGPKCEKWAHKWEKKEGCRPEWRAHKAAKWEAKRAHHAEKWESKKAFWDAKREKIMNDPELRKEKLEHLGNKVKKLQERKQWLENKVAENVNPGFAHRLAHVEKKLHRIESFRAMLENTAPLNPTAPAFEPTPSNPNVTEADLNAAKTTRALFVSGLTETHLQIQMKKTELQALRAQARTAENRQEVTEKAANIRKEIEDLKITHQEKKAALQAHDAQIRTIRQDLLKLKKQQKH